MDLAEEKTDEELLNIYELSQYQLEAAFSLLLHLPHGEVVFSPPRAVLTSATSQTRRASLIQQAVWPQLGQEGTDGGMKVLTNHRRMASRSSSPTLAIAFS
jgi:hypothetical protein